jgi:hypothetical protein
LRSAAAGSNPPRPTGLRKREFLNKVSGQEASSSNSAFLKMWSWFVPKETEVATPAASRAEVYMARAKMAEDWSAKTADAELRQSWLKIAEEYRLLVRALWINPKR